MFVAKILDNYSEREADNTKATEVVASKETCALIL